MNLIIIMSVYVALGLSVVLRFFAKQKNIRSTFSKKNEELLNGIKHQKMQIDNRQERLKLYNFQIYNIEEVLITQPNITL